MAGMLIKHNLLLLGFVNKLAGMVNRLCDTVYMRGCHDSNGYRRQDIKDRCQGSDYIYSYGCNIRIDTHYLYTVRMAECDVSIGDMRCSKCLVTVGSYHIRGR